MAGYVLSSSRQSSGSSATRSLLTKKCRGLHERQKCESCNAAPRSKMSGRFFPSRPQGWSANRALRPFERELKSVAMGSRPSFRPGKTNGHSWLVKVRASGERAESGKESASREWLLLEWRSNPACRAAARRLRAQKRRNSYVFSGNLVIPSSVPDHFAPALRCESDGASRQRDFDSRFRAFEEERQSARCFGCALFARAVRGHPSP